MWILWVGGQIFWNLLEVGYHIPQPQTLSLKPAATHLRCQPIFSHTFTFSFSGEKCVFVAFVFWPHISSLPCSTVAPTVTTLCNSFLEGPKGTPVGRIRFSSCLQHLIAPFLGCSPSWPPSYSYFPGSSSFSAYFFSVYSSTDSCPQFWSVSTI